MATTAVRSETAEMRFSGRPAFQSLMMFSTRLGVGEKAGSPGADAP
jgi:hypothetical protein